MLSSSHIAQTLTLLNPDIRRVQTGVEREFGKFTFKLKVDKDVVIVKVIPKYKPTMGFSVENPNTLLITEEVDTKKIGMLELISYSTATDVKDQHFGFKYVFKDFVRDLKEGDFLTEGTILADSNSIDDQENYRYGVETNTAFMSVPGTIEDGVVASESFMKRLTTLGYERRVVSFGKKQYPLNLYGDGRHYKPFPDIGDHVRSDGLLFALRTYDDYLGPVEMEPTALQEPDYIYDDLTYGIPNARIIDINIRHDVNLKNPPTPKGMELQPDKYWNSIKQYYKSILEVYNKLYSARRENLLLTFEFQRLVVEAMSYLDFDDNPATKFIDKSGRLSKLKIQKTFKRSEIDDYRVEVIMETVITPKPGAKITDLHGGKGVICDVWPDDQMPVDKNGNRAELIMDGDGTIKRMNLGRLYEQYINACSRDISDHVRALVKTDPKGYDKAWDMLLKYYKVTSPKMYDVITSKSYKKTPKHHVDEIVKDGIYLWLPIDNPRNYLDVVRDLRGNFPLVHDKITYADGVESAAPVLIGSLYILLLEKTGNDFSGVSSAKLQHFGMPARVNNSDRFSTPGRNQPVRILGESEVRLLLATIGSDTTVDILDQSNSPLTHKEIVDNILKSDMPTRIDEVIDRNKIPLGNSRNLLYVKHILECAGIKYVRELDDPLRAQEVEAKGGFK